MIDTSKFVGLTEAEARKLGADAGLRIVVHSQLGDLLTNSFEMSRVTLVMSGGVVLRATIG